MSGVCPRGGEEQQQTVVGGVGGEVPGGRGACLSFYHVPQQCRREKLRYPNADEPPRWPLHALPSPPSLFHCDTSLSTAVAPATASFMPPSSSLVPNPGYNATPYGHGFTPIHLLDHHYGLLGGTKGHQVQGVSLSLSSSAPPSHSSDQHHYGQAVCATAFTGQLQLPPTVPRIGLVPTGPFTGYAAILQGSRFLKPAQQLLEAACGGGSTMVGAMVCSGGEVEQLDLVADGLGDCSENVDSRLIGNGASRKMKSRLISMLDEVCKRYKQYYEQIQAVITSFEVVAGLNTAAPYIYVALRSLSKHFKCLKSAISDQLQFETIALGKDGQSKDEMPGHRGMNGSLCYQQSVMHSPGAINPQPVWRPQRGLPERAVAVLRAWLFEHFLHPYPTDMDKQMLAKQTGLSRNQVSNWFINARVRLWKPMVEEIHSLELQQVHIPEGGRHCDASKHLVFSSSTTAVSPNNKQTPPNIIGEKIPEQRHKRLRDELPQLPNHIKEPLKFSFDDLSPNHRGSVPMGFASAAANGGISLTLGLHQTDGVCFSEPLPLNIVRRFGLEESSVAYAMGGFDGQDRHFGRDIDGQLLRRHFGAR